MAGELIRVPAQPKLDDAALGRFAEQVIAAIKALRERVLGAELQTLVIPQSFAIANGMGDLGQADWEYEDLVAAPAARARWFSLIASGRLDYPLRGTVPDGATVTGFKAKVTPAVGISPLSVSLVRYAPQFETPSAVPTAGTVLGTVSADFTGNVQTPTLGGLSEVIDYSRFDYYLRVAATSAPPDRCYGAAVTFRRP